MMPTYLITDTHAGHRVMVEAARPQAALQTLIADRFEVSSALEVAEAVRLTKQGVDLLESGEANAMNRPIEADEDTLPPPAAARPPLDAFAPEPDHEPEDDADEAPEFAEVEPYDSEGDVAPMDPVDEAYAALR